MSFSFIVSMVLLASGRNCLSGPQDQASTAVVEGWQFHTSPPGPERWAQILHSSSFLCIKRACGKRCVNVWVWLTETKSLRVWPWQGTSTSLLLTHHYSFRKCSHQLQWCMSKYCDYSSVHEQEKRKVIFWLFVQPDFLPF